MGRQVEFYALPEDLTKFLDFACARDPVIVTLRDTDRPEIEPVKNSGRETRVMTLWNRGLLPALQRELVKRPPSWDYYGVASFLPVLELSPSVASSWKGRGALLSGRLYGSDFDINPPEYGIWYARLRRWIRANFARSPVSGLATYIGPAALAWFHQGGILFPTFVPPVTAAWESVIEAQQVVRTASKP